MNNQSILKQQIDDKDYFSKNKTNIFPDNKSIQIEEFIKTNWGKIQQHLIQNKETLISFDEFWIGTIGIGNPELEYFLQRDQALISEPLFPIRITTDTTPEDLIKHYRLKVIDNSKKN